MDDGPKDLDRKLLAPRKAFRPGDPERVLRDGEFDLLFEHFSEAETATATELRPSLDALFGSILDIAKRERFREDDGRLEQVAKSSTIVAKEMKQLKKACETLELRLSQLDSASQTWIDKFLKDGCAKNPSGKRLRLRDLKQDIYRPIDLLISAAGDAEGITNRGPNNIALREMIVELAHRWKTYYVVWPKADKARDRQDDPFLRLCQEMARIVNNRLGEKAGGLGTLTLSRLVEDVLNNRSP